MRHSSVIKFNSRKSDNAHGVILQGDSWGCDNPDGQDQKGDTKIMKSACSSQVTQAQD